jgi:serine O-acetyltransferase
VRLTELLREDWKTNSPRALIRPGFHALAMHRLGHAAGARTGPGRLPLRIVRALLNFLSQVVYGVDLPGQAAVGRRLVIGHHGGIVVAANATIGDDCLIRQNVTIGMAVEGGRAPRVGNRVQIGAGAVIVGDIEVGDGVVIGPNAVVTTDVPAAARVVAPPARILVARGDVPLPPPVEPARADGREADVADVLATIESALMLDTALEPDTPLLSSGLVDSLNVAVLLDALESRYAVSVSAEDVSAETFDTARQIADHLHSRRS